MNSEESITNTSANTSTNTAQKRVLIVGATGYIGSAVVAEAVQQGHEVIAVSRSPRGADRFDGATVVQADVTDPASIATAFSGKIDAVISCLGCHSGLAKDFDAIDYKATLNVLSAALANGTKEFILLSAICVRVPELPLQLAKLKFEDELMRSGINYTIVRPTAYFWVFEAQNKMIANGKPAYLIGSGEQACHNPISKEDLADFMVGSIGNPERQDRVFVIGGPEVPDNIITYKEAAKMVFEALGKEPKFISVPGWAMTAVVRLTWFVGLFFRKIGVFSEFLKIVHYYLKYDMRAPGYGSMTYKQHVIDTVGNAESQ
jgi:divinyl chlorophyllide a 8-vinyl-reductase